ncbi:collagen alpha-3(VI) chain-like isoform X4 [Phycodurus eques]|uniref:collagen alpha-3(VI) chain-like isoform X4 n=1 Tax=Phycodurus eques TaxID=693459 RepID=UPI002ACDD30D|nr:collagen alpha-3(VI) chain-like isoform X4 [Phycodurus eques]
MTRHRLLPLCALLGVLFSGFLPKLDAQDALAVGERDIIFLLDSTMGATVINSVREYIRKFIDIMPIGPDGVQVGLAQFSNVPRLEMDLNSYGSKDELTTALGRIKPRPGQAVNIGAALDFVRTDMLRPDKGSRLQRGVPQLLLLMTTKRSADDVRGPARALLQMGVLTLAAGSKTAEEQELKEIAFDESVVFMMKDFRMLHRNPNTIMNALSTLAGIVVTEVPTEPVVEITTVQTQKVVRDIVFLVDGSNYIGSNNFPYVRDFMINVVNQLEVNPERVQIGLMQFAEQPKIEFYLNTARDRQDVVDRITQLRLTGGSVLNTGAAMEYALRNMFSTSAGSRKRQGVQQVLVLITGGPAQDEMKSVADKLALEGVLTFVVSSGQADQAVLQTVAFVPDLAYHESSFSYLPAMAEQIIPKLIAVVGDTDLSTVTEEPVVSGSERDVAFLIDGTDFVRSDFAYVQDFILKVIEPLDIGSDKVRVAVVQHSERPTPNFYLNTYQTKEEVVRAVSQMTLAGGRSLNTGSALTFMRDTILSERYGSRRARSVPQFLIVLTGRRSRDNVKEPAGVLKTEGVVPFGVGVKDADQRQIEEISHNPSFAFKVKEFNELGTVPQRLNTFVGLPRAELDTVLREVQGHAVKRDIVFLLDGSEKTRNGFSDIKLFLKSIVESLYVSENQDRVSVVQFADKPNVNFYLNSHKTESDIMNAIDNLRHGGGGERLNVGAALQFVRHSVFTSSSGSRRLEGVPQILILLATNPSTDDIKSPALALKDHEIVSLGVAVGDANFSDLETVTFEPGFIYKITRVSELPSIKSKLVAALNANKDATESTSGLIGRTKRDIVFLLDGSDASRNGLPAIREFIRRMVEELDIDDDKVRVAVLQYSDDTSIYFNLTAHGSKRAIIYAVRSLRHKGGRLRNTGAALEFVRDFIFNAASGSRVVQGVPQILFLLSGGESDDDISGAAADLQQMGVLSFAIGMKNGKQEELEEIASSSAHIFNLPVFGELLSVQQEIVSFVQVGKALEAPVVEQSPQRDIVFLVDGSDETMSGFPAIKSFIKRVVETLTVGENGDRVSVVQYSSDPQMHFSFNTYTDLQDVLTTVEQLKHKGGGPLNTGAALEYVRTKTFAQSSGSRHREGVPQILILLSGGVSRDEVRSAAAALKQDQVVAFCIGTKSSDLLELQTIAHIPSYAFALRQFEDIGRIYQQLVSFVKRVPRHTRPTPLTVLESRKNDVVFLIDGSYDSRNGFEAIRQFIEQMAENLSLDDRDQVAVVQYSRNSTVNFYLNSYSSKTDVLNSIRTMGHKYGRPLYLGKALEFVRDNVFAASVGGRRASLVPQYLFVFSGGRSRDDVRGPAQSLKENGIKTFSIGTSNADTLEMQNISFTPSHYFSITSFTNLPSVQESVKAMLSDVDDITGNTPAVGTSTVTQLELGPADVVFLLAGSDDMRANEGTVLDFVRQFVQEVEIGPTNVQIAVIQYSKEATADFVLNSYGQKDVLLSHLSNVKLRGGSAVNTGAALNFAQKYVYTASAGSRAKQGIPQTMIVLSGKKSDDNVAEPRDSLRDAGIVLYTIGMNDADRQEMEELSHSVETAHFINVTSDIPIVTQRLLSAILSRKSIADPGIAATHTKKDIVFLLDGSDGTRNGFPAMRDFVERVVESFNMGGDRDRVSVVQYSRDAEANFYLNTYTTKEDIIDAVRGLRHRGGRPLNTGAALRYVRDNVFTKSSGSRSLEGVPQILILLNSRRSFDSVDAAASALKQDGIYTISIGTRSSDSNELQKLSHDHSYALSVFDFTGLQNVQEKLFSVMSRVLSATSMTTKMTVNRHGRDYVFLLDGSDTTRTAFPSMRDFIKKVVETLSVDDDKDRVSLIQYSRNAIVQFYLNTYTTKGEILEIVRGLRHRGGTPLNTGAALQYLRDNVFTASAGSRRLEGVPQVLILLSGGRSFDRVDAPASALKKLGVLIFTIGTTRSDRGELQKIAHDPRYALSVPEFTDLPSVQQQLHSSVEAVVIDGSPETPPVIAEAKNDIVFLLDGSDGTRSGFPTMRDFVAQVVEKLNVGEDKDRVSVVQYSRDAEVNFYLNTYTTREDIVDAVRGLRHRGGRPLNTGAALRYVRNNVFTNSSGSRRPQGFPQILILLNGGRSSDSVDAPASALKQQGIFTISIGTQNSDSSELKKISHDPSNALAVSELTDLPSVQEQLSSVINRVLRAATPMTPTVTADRTGRDVVFLLDGSDATRSSFPAMRDFVQRVVESLSVDDNKDRVSLIQYSGNAAVQFYLNTYTTKGEILDIVRGLRHRGGTTLNTGAALQYLRDNVFTTSAGSRRLDGVPQVLILLSGGRSFDRVDAPASALKKLGVLIFTIGTTRSDRGELQKIAHDPRYALSVPEFTDLPSVQQQLQSSVEDVVIDVSPETPPVIAEAKKDIVFLLDGSDGTRSGFPTMRDFVEQVVEKLNVGVDKDCVSVVQYSRDAEANFYLNTYTTREDIVDAVRGLRHRGGRPLNTGAALRYVRDNVFTNSSGSRRPQGVPQILILLNGGRSSDSVDVPASALKQQGIFTISIGTQNSDSSELKKISHDPSNALAVSELTDLPSVQEQLSSVINRVLRAATPMTPTVTAEAKKDIVFLLDGSDGTRSGFPTMRDFVEQVVEKLNVGVDKDRVSVVQYSRDAEANFYLNTYTTREDIVDAVRGLRHRGGRPLNTGAALRYVRDNVFTNSSGSRRPQGVPQILILLNGGRSSDSVDVPASALKQQGIFTISIGTQNSDSSELKKISHDPSNALAVSELTDLPSVQEQLSSVINRVLRAATPMTPTVTGKRALHPKHMKS